MGNLDPQLLEKDGGLNCSNWASRNCEEAADDVSKFWRVHHKKVTK